MLGNHPMGQDVKLSLILSLQRILLERERFTTVILELRESTYYEPTVECIRS